jgi:hypothetical protein
VIKIFLPGNASGNIKLWFEAEPSGTGDSVTYTVRLLQVDAAVKEAEPVTLSGVDLPFRFTDGALSVRRSQIQAFTIAGYGNLPPALVGEAQAFIALNVTQQNGGLALQAATAALDKSADPLRCENTQFSITLSKLGLKYVQQQKDYHFYFTLTGAAEFQPSSGAFANGLLKNLSSLKIVLNEAPLATDPRVLLKRIEFQVTVDPPKRSSFFGLFSFELRGVGFHPSSEAFGGSPALSISGQVKFTDFGDVVSPRFDFHKLRIAPPEQGQVLHRIRFDGLGVGLALGSMGDVTGTAIAVDGELPTLVTSGLPTKVLGEGMKAKGFLASGSVNIQGWGPISASMGFLELERPGAAERRQAFCLYLQRNDMSEKIPTPIGTLFLRGVGFGFDYRYTLAGIAAADKAQTLRELVQILDEVSKYQGSLDDVRTWWPTFDNAGLTLSLRGLFSISSMSSPDEYNEEGEKELANLVLFDIVAALRTDLTFLMNVRAWIAYNYADWRQARFDKAPWRDNPTLRQDGPPFDPAGASAQGPIAHCLLPRALGPTLLRATRLQPAVPLVSRSGPGVGWARSIELQPPARAPGGNRHRRCFFDEVVRLAPKDKQLSSDNFTVNGTLIDAWASFKSFKPKNGEPPTPGSDGTGMVDFKGEKRSNATHQSSTDPEAKLMRKGNGQPAGGHALMQNRSGLCVDLLITDATLAEHQTARQLLIRARRRKIHPKTQGADKGYHVKDFVQHLREHKIKPHIAWIDGRKTPGLDGRTTCTEGYKVSQRKRKRIEEIFGWLKTVGGMRKTRFIGEARTQIAAYLSAAVYSLLRIAKLQSAGSAA